ncbi:MAG: excinuclease ABC subunit A, partial [Planctomycetales bacterium]
ALEEAARLAPSLRGKYDAVIDEVDCSVCDGSRLRDDAGAFRLHDKTIDAVCRLPLSDARDFFQQLQLDAKGKKIAGDVVREIHSRLEFMVEVGLDYLTLRRSAPTLSGGEAQRIRLASQIGSGLTGVLYVLDEPTIGLHPRDNARLIKALQRLRDLGNTLLLVEHDREVIAAADRLLDFGPAAGDHGGRIVAQGTPAQIRKRKASVTGPFLSGKSAIPVPAERRMKSRLSPGEAPAKSRRKKTPAPKSNGQGDFFPDGLPLPPGDGWLEVQGARHNNLRDVSIQIPLGTLCAITGVSGSGKSSLIEDVLYKAIARRLHRARTIPGAHDAIVGLDRVNKVIRVDQHPLGNSPTSTPAT